MSVLRNGMLAMVLLLLGGCMMMDRHGSHRAAMETTSEGAATESKGSSRQEASAADRERETKRKYDASHAGNMSGMAILGGAFMVVMMLAMML